MRHFFVPTTMSLALALSGCGGSGGTAALPVQTGVSNAAPQSSTVAAGQTTGSLSARRTVGSLSRRGVVPKTAATGINHICAAPTSSAHASCFAAVRTDSLISSVFPDDVNGLTPNDLSALYKYPAPGTQGSRGTGETVGVIVVGDYAAAESDLGVYRAHFGLPPCTTKNGCLKKIGVPSTFQISMLTGGSSSISAYATSVSAYATTPSTTGWAGEVDTDTEMISATCPNCKILIAEAASDSISDLTNAVNAAINSGVNIVNASFGAPESSSDYSLEGMNAYYNYQNVKVVAAAGDWGYGVYFPASNPDVIAVGGTTLSVNGSTVTESAWSGTGSGCSALFYKQFWQNIPGGCNKRAVVDISAVADPNTGVAVYDSTLSGSSGGWATFGGTSVAAPIITGLYALSGDTARNIGAQSLYAAPASNFLKITSGSNGTCSPAYLCMSMGVYSGPTGLGVPQGLGGF